jgi:ClpP class serine protease
VTRTLGSYYDLFLQRVSLRRKIARPRLLRLAEGRLWLGDEALGHGLVDGNGGTLAAIAEVRKRTRLIGDQDVVVEFWPRPSFRSALRRWAGLSTETSLPTSAMVKLLDGATAGWLDRAMLIKVLGAGQPLALTAVPLDAPAR